MSLQLITENMLLIKTLHLTAHIFFQEKCQMAVCWFFHRDRLRRTTELY